jgi:hypothetical protein
MKRRIWQNLYTFKIFIFIQKNLTQVMQFIGGLVIILKKMLQKNPFKTPFYEKVKMLKKTHLWLNSLSLLAHLIMIAPIKLLKYVHIKKKIIVR